MHSKTNKRDKELENVLHNQEEKKKISTNDMRELAGKNFKTTIITYFRYRRSACLA